MCSLVFFAKIIHSPDRCCISRRWLNNMIGAQVCFGLATVKALYDVQFWGSAHLDVMIAECPPEWFPVNWLLISPP